MSSDTYECGHRGCSAKTRRRGVERYCAQLAIFWDDEGKGYCYYHNPKNPKKFGEGYLGQRTVYDTEE